MIPSKKIRFLLNEFAVDLGELKSLELLYESFQGSQKVYLTGMESGNFILKIYPEKYFNVFASVFQSKMASFIKCPKIYQGTRQKYFVESTTIDGETYFATLQEYVENVPWNFDASNVAKIAQQLGHFHRKSKKMMKSEDRLQIPKFRVISELSELQKFIIQDNRIPNSRDFLRWVDQQIEKYIDAHCRIGRYHQGIMHGDYHHGNILLDSKGDPYIIDFDDLSFGLPYEDVARFLLQAIYFSLVQKKTFKIDKRRFFEIFIQNYADHFNSEIFLCCSEIVLTHLIMIGFIRSHGKISPDTCSSILEKVKENCSNFKT